MRETLLIRLASHAHQTLYWWRFTADNQLSTSGEIPDAAGLADWPFCASDTQIIALVPACDVLLRTVTIPGRLNRKTRKALPFLLEDEAVDEVEKLHITVLAAESPLVHLAAVDRTLMQMWQAWLDSAGLSPVQMLPDVFALPRVEGGCYWRLGEQQLIRESHWQGMVLEAGLLAAFPPERVARWQACTAAVPLSVTHLPAASLLQGDGQLPRQQARGLWRTPGYLLSLWLVLALITWGLEGYRQYREDAKANARMQVLYQKAFPGSKPAQDPWREFNRKTSRYSGAFLPLLRALDGALPAAAAVKALAFDIATPGLKVELAGTSLMAINSLKQRLPPGFRLSQTESGEVTLMAPRKVPEPPLSVAQQLRQMTQQVAQKPAVEARTGDPAALLTRTGQSAQLPVLTVAAQREALAVNFAGVVRFTRLAEWLQTLEYQFGIVVQQLRLADKGQGEVEVKQLTLSSGGL
ncbi:MULTISPECIES: type II secretion system protein GspL [unclassified Leclercia]|uniref:Type II secretion system protein M n=1 Tax=Leclercia barmai TaxID=2785629 RepID=A0ABS7RZ19_9ENTR|nr:MULTISPECIES: type II secretion system protein GspL [unclassified Leclercia]MBZ0059563.1 type II secretion system protein M [Leclercia sp. EMC7]MCM5697304.1 type II secretion system protein GspL [Leclercia sp. LTM01]MCM5702099.1 type II secretion system protein M [Leclercia sp. LTM14]